MSPDSIVNKLRARSGRRRLLAIVGIFAGLPCCLFAPLLLGSLFWFSHAQLFGFIHWNYFILGATVVCLPLLFSLEIRTKGGYLDGVMSDPGPELPGGADVARRLMVFGMLPTVAAGAAVEPRRSVAGVVELFLFGPRLIVNGIRHLRQTRKLPPTNLKLAAKILTLLCERESGIPIEMLKSRKVEPADVDNAIFWLVFYGWIGISKDWQKIFIYSESRAAFQD